MTAYGLGSGLHAFADHHPGALRVAVLAAIFGSGWFDAKILKSKAAACMTWITGLGALAFWIGYPSTTARLLAGAVVFLAGSVLMIVYYRRPILHS